MLSREKFEDSLIDAVVFFNLPVSYLMQYACMGRLAERGGLYNEYMMGMGYTASCEVLV